MHTQRRPVKCSTQECLIATNNFFKQKILVRELCEKVPKLGQIINFKKVTYPIFLKTKYA